VSTTYGEYALFMICSFDAPLIDSLRRVSYKFVSNSQELFFTYTKVADLHALGLLLTHKEMEVPFIRSLDETLRKYEKNKALRMTL